ncbi:MAG TPA: hypothetical protein VF188_13605 [Longimicrobiales bacterium]
MTPTRRVDRARRAGTDAREAARKAIHVVASGAAAALAATLPGRTLRPLFLGALVIAVAVEVARALNPAARRLFRRAFGPMLRAREAHGITGATTLAAGFFAAVFLAPPRFAAAGILAAGIGDAAAALVGRRYGRHRLAAGRTLEGTAACFVAALAAAYAMPGIDAPAAVAAAATTALVEALPFPFDDNLVLPPVAAVAAVAARAAAPLTG